MKWSHEYLVVAAFACCVGASACSNRSDNVATRRVTSQRHLSPATRVFDTAGRSWRVLWKYDGHAAGSMMMFPAALVADARSVFVLDAAMQRVQRYDAGNGRLTWMFPDRASGGRLSDGVALALGRDGDLAILERASRTIRLVAPDGSERRTISVPTRGDPIALCVTDRGLIIGIQGQDDDPLLYLSDSGEVTARASLSWESDSAVSILRQFRLTGNSRSSGCALVHSLALGMTWVGASGVAPTQRYVERMDLPRATVTVDSSVWGQRKRTEQILDHQQAAIAAALDRDELVIAFGGRTKLAGRIIDVYSAPDLAYKRSMVFPTRITSMSRVGGTYYIIADSAGAPVLFAAREIRR
jgi:hypothetical protein